MRQKMYYGDKTKISWRREKMTQYKWILNSYSIFYLQQQPKQNNKMSFEKNEVTK